MSLATPNYSYEKRQRELAKKKKTEEKRQRKLQKPDGSPDQDAPAEDGSSEAVPNEGGVSSDPAAPATSS
jgi:hypothetical protein